MNFITFGLRGVSVLNEFCTDEFVKVKIYSKGAMGECVMSQLDSVGCLGDSRWISRRLQTCVAMLDFVQLSSSRVKDGGGVGKVLLDGCDLT